MGALLRLLALTQLGVADEHRQKLDQSVLYCCTLIPYNLLSSSSGAARGARGTLDTAGSTSAASHGTAAAAFASARHSGATTGSGAPGQVFSYMSFSI